jgi:GNAT superfamily N-acetyltransferase
MLDNAQYKEFVFDGNQLVGFIRVLTDFSYNAFVADLAVYPSHQSRGIGAELLYRATAKYPGVKFILQSSPETEAFYINRGFKEAEHCVMLMRSF